MSNRCFIQKIAFVFLFVNQSTLTLSTQLQRASLGFDYGTSGVRCCVVSVDSMRRKSLIHESNILWTAQPESLTDISERWKSALHNLLDTIPTNVANKINRVSVSGTSSTCMLYDTDRNFVSRDIRFYDYNILKYATKEQSQSIMELLSKYCPPGSAAAAPTSTLAKLLLWHYENPLLNSERLSHQADFIANELLSVEDNNMFISDWHNALKLGYDVVTLKYPDWLISLLLSVGISSPMSVLPKVVEPGKKIGQISEAVATKYGIPASCVVVGGTTDSIAAFLASGASTPGQAVSSLGSTLAIKLLSRTPVSDTSRGIYSHRLGDQWLVGGASNVGCAVLRQQNFSSAELAACSEQIDHESDSPLDYYPLTQMGERFPENDATKLPVLDPKPTTRAEYLHGILQGIARVESKGYQALAELGATPPTEVLTCGGGAVNDMWMRMRQRLLGVPTRRADNVDAAFGAACLGLLYDDI